MKIYSDPVSCTKFMPHWIKDFRIKPYSMILVVEKEGKSLEHIDTGENFLNSTPIAFH